MPHPSPLASSFRDPSGRLFRSQGKLLRQINTAYAPEYDRLMGSGLYQRLVEEGLLVPHQEVALNLALDAAASTVIEPQELPYISYPWEWCFSQLQDAALATLKIQQIALDYGMSLKDASAFNIQFQRGRPCLIDTLSFEMYQEGAPWPAYRQFCQHFLAPLLLVSWCDYRLLKLLRGYIDGIPLDLASRLLPARSWLKYSVLAHIHLHARAQQRHAANALSMEQARQVKVSATGMRGLIDGLSRCVRALRWRMGSSEWGNYYQDTNYVDSAMEHKSQLVDECLAQVNRDNGLLLDLGANTGRFSRLGLKHGFQIIAMDVDEVAVERCYLQSREAGEAVLPLVQDLTNPTPVLGWSHTERMSLLQRGPVDVVMALALIHHLTIANNVPLTACAEFFAQLGSRLIIEFVPKSDSQVQRLLRSRQDIFPDYTQEGFESAFGGYFEVIRSEAIRDSQRHLYWLAARTA